MADTEARSVQAVWEAAKREADHDLANLPWRQRARVYLSGGQGCEHWVDVRAAHILAAEVVRLRAERGPDG